MATFAREDEVQHATDAMGMLAVSGSGGGESSSSSSGRTHLVGRAGSMAPPSPPARNIEPQGLADTDYIGWNEFAKNYAAGNFDPVKIPHPPTESLASPTTASARSSPGTRYPSLSQAVTGQEEPSSSDTNYSGTSGATSASLLSGATDASSAPSISPSRSISSAAVVTKGVAIKAKSLEAENLLQRSQSSRPNKVMLPSYNLAAATVRMASASSGLSSGSLAPLGVPSPDKELTDPMANFVSTSSVNKKEDSTSDPSHGTRYPLSRSMSSALEPDRSLLHQLPTIAASPVASPFEHPRHTRSKLDQTSSKLASPSWMKGGLLQSNIHPATAPVEKTIEAASQEDYFGAAVSPPPSSNISRHPSYASGSSGSQQTVTGPLPTPAAFSDHPDERDETPPSTSPQESPPRSVNYNQMSEIYEKFGWLPAPLPPDELARRRALYRFNILHTAADLNFDRIAHMAKLVFASKIVLIALIDGETQWHKTQAGPAINEEVPRAGGFCAHTILSK